MKFSILFFILFLFLGLLGCAEIERFSYVSVSTDYLPSDNVVEKPEIILEGPVHPILILFIPVSLDWSGMQEVVALAAGKYQNCYGFKNVEIKKETFGFPEIYLAQQWTLKGIPLVRE